jgi:hypothetical protein
VDVIPLILYGTGKALPKHGRLLNKWPAHLEIDKRISPSEMKMYGETLQQQAAAMRKYYQKRYSEIANKIEQNV